MIARIPIWNQNNLKRHYLKRINQDPGCFEDLMGINYGVMTEFQYEWRSEQAVINAWAQYRCESYDPILRKYRPLRMYFVDDQLEPVS